MTGVFVSFKPKAVVGSFPYPHRTVAEVDRDMGFTPREDAFEVLMEKWEGRK